MRYCPHKLLYFRLLFLNYLNHYLNNRLVSKKKGRSSFNVMFGNPVPVSKPITLILILSISSIFFYTLLKS